MANEGQVKLKIILLKFGAHDGGRVKVPDGTTRIYLPLQWEPMAEFVRNGGDYSKAYPSKIDADLDVKWSALRSRSFPIPYELNKRTNIFIEDRMGSL